MILAPGIAQTAIVFDEQFIKDNLNNIVNDLIEKTVDIAKPALTDAAERSIPLITIYVASSIKNNVPSKVPAIIKPIVDAGIDSLANTSEASIKQSIDPMIDSSLTTTAEISKKSLKTLVDFSVDSTSSFFSRFFIWFTT